MFMNKKMNYAEVFSFQRFIVLFLKNFLFEEVILSCRGSILSDLDVLNVHRIKYFKMNAGFLTLRFHFHGIE